jgi:para-nitrobenzyl esterase
MRSLTFLFAALLALSGASAAAPAPSPAPPPAAPVVVLTDKGPVQATPRGGMRSFFAIPYAAPPVGDLRWRAPRPAPAWTAPIARAASAVPCLQTGRSPFRSLGEQEDCLYLDVHTPVGPGPFPVMVWIHGGAFTTGGAAVYADPSRLVAKGVIVVAMNYRLGALGFLAHPALRDESGASGDYGIMDQQAALRWVRTNIAAFGGDPRNVTIFGESAGGFSVLTHLASPLSAGLFDKAIIESGAYGVAGQLTQAGMEARSAAALDKALAAIGADAGPACAVGPPTAACLRGLTEAAVKAHLMSAFGEAVGNVVPSVDGKVLPRTIRDIFAAGANTRVPVINGSNENENRLFVALAELGARFKAGPPNLDPANRSFLPTPEAYAKAAQGLGQESGVPADAITTRYYPLAAQGPDTALQPAFAIAAAGTDATFACNGANVSARIAAQGGKVWHYEFRDQRALPIVGTFLGRYDLSLPQAAAHGTELPYLFTMADLADDGRKALAETMSTYWTNFAKSGDPNGAGAPPWPSFAGGSFQALDEASAGGVKARPVAEFLAAHQCRTAWAKETF